MCSPLRTRASLHSIKQCKVVQRPSAIFRCEDSKSITETEAWDSWISTSRGTVVIMHLYLSTSSSLCLYHHQIHFPVRQYCISPWAWPVVIEILLNINIDCGRNVAHCLFCIQWNGRGTRSEMKRRHSRRTQFMSLPGFLQIAATDGSLKRYAPNMFHTSPYLHILSQNAQAAHYTWFTNSFGVYSFCTKLWRSIYLMQPWQAASRHFS